MALACARVGMWRKRFLRYSCEFAGTDADVFYRCAVVAPSLYEMTRLLLQGTREDVGVQLVRHRFFRRVFSASWGFEAAHEVCVHACVFAAPFVEGGTADAMLTTQCGYGYA